MKSQQARARERKKRDKQDFEECQRKNDGICEVCGAMGEHLHHARTKRVDIRHDPRFHIFTCQLCHRFFHEQPEKGRQWLEERGRWYIVE